MTHGLVLVALIGVLDFVTGYELSLSLLYFVPILLVTWWAGRREGVTVACFSARVWLGAVIRGGRTFTHPLIPFWNALVRLGFSLIVVTLLSQLQCS